MTDFESPDTDEPKILCDICEWKYLWGCNNPEILCNVCNLGNNKKCINKCLYGNDILSEDEKFCKNFMFNSYETGKRCFGIEYTEKINILINRGFLIYIPNLQRLLF